MLVKTRLSPILSVLLLCTPVAVNAGEDWIDSVTLGFGYTKANSSLTRLNGGVDDVDEPDSGGRGFAATMVFDYDLLPRLSPYVDFANLIQDDRDFLITTAGLRYRFDTDDDTLRPFLGAGASYVFADWNESPVANAITSEPDGQSYGLSVHGGVDMYITEHLAFNVTARFDSYDIGTSVVENSRVTTIDDKSSFSALIGLTYRFGKPEPAPLDSDRDGVADARDRCPDTPYGAPVDEHGCPLDSDSDGVIDLRDCCPNTLAGVPVTRCGCPPWKFDFNLELEFDKFRIADYRYKPVFDIVAFLNKHPEYQLRITGHTDDVGSASYNLALSKWRANAARDFLVDRGIAEERIHTLGKGEQEPLVDNLTAEQRAMNRRIHVEIYRADENPSTQIAPISPPTGNENDQETAQ